MSQDYKVKDINLAEFGRKEISLAETEMPGLMALRKEYKTKKPLTVVRPGSQTRRFTHVFNTVEICFMAWKKNLCR